MSTFLLQTQLPAANLPYLFAALAVSWAVFFVYAIWVSRRQEDLRREIEELRQSLGGGDSGG